MAIDLLLGSNWLRLISIYLPHSDYPFENVYDCIQQAINDGGSGPSDDDAQ